MLTVSPISAFSDNYIWHLQHNDQHWVVDPGDAAPVVSALQESKLDGILITHHHWDHTGGVTALVSRYNCPVYGPSSIENVTHPLGDGDQCEILGLPLSVMSVPGHTLDHIALILQEGDESGRQPHLFCGDTLFAGGCGRLFEGTPAQMYDSLTRLGSLPPETLVYCAHEYTLANLLFAEVAEPGNHAIQSRITEVKERRSAGTPSLPSTLGEELATNPFLRCHIPALARQASSHGASNNPDEIEVFTYLRHWKDNF